jgi:hypothetical protein
VLHWVQCPKGDLDTEFVEMAPNAMARDLITAEFGKGFSSLVRANSN